MSNTPKLTPLFLLSPSSRLSSPSAHQHPWLATVVSIGILCLVIMAALCMAASGRKQESVRRLAPSFSGQGGVGPWEEEAHLGSGGLRSRPASSAAGGGLFGEFVDGGKLFLRKGIQRNSHTKTDKTEGGEEGEGHGHGIKGEEDEAASGREDRQ